MIDLTGVYQPPVKKLNLIIYDLFYFPSFEIPQFFNNYKTVILIILIYVLHFFYYFFTGVIAYQELYRHLKYG